jgi:hypothetical protein
MDVFSYTDWLAQSLQMVIEAAGAQRCLTVSAKAEVGAERAITLYDIPLEESGSRPDIGGELYCTDSDSSGTGRCFLGTALYRRSVCCRAPDPVAALPSDCAPRKNFRAAL